MIHFHILRMKVWDKDKTMSMNKRNGRPWLKVAKTNDEDMRQISKTVLL